MASIFTNMLRQNLADSGLQPVSLTAHLLPKERTVSTQVQGTQIQSAPAPMLRASGNRFAA